MCWAWDSKAALAADRTSPGVGLAFGSPRAAANLLTKRRHVGDLEL